MKKLIEAKLGDIVYLVSPAGFITETEVYSMDGEALRTNRCSIWHSDKHVKHAGVVSVKTNHSQAEFATLEKSKALSLAIQKSKQLIQSHTENLVNLTNSLLDV